MSFKNLLLRNNWANFNLTWNPLMKGAQVLKNKGPFNFQREDTCMFFSLNQCYDVI